MALPHGSNMSPIAREYLSGLTSNDAPTLPGCTANEPEDKPILISNDMLQAYVMMRGPVDKGNPLASPNDPLLDWIRMREGLQKQNGHVPGDRNKDIKRMLSNVERVLQSEESLQDSPQTSVFEFQRPNVEHIQPPPGMDLSMQMLNACCADFEFAEDESDEEEHIPRGRISPCTFLAWSKDCTPWGKGHYETPGSKIPETASRQRPQSPELCDTPPSSPRSDRWPKSAQYQKCRESGDPISPYYHVPSSPSMLWDAEGIDHDRMDLNPHFEDYYSRMDYKSAKKLRRLKQFGKPTSEALSPASKNELYGDSEVDEIIAHDCEESGTGMDLQSARKYISEQREIVHAVHAESNQLDSAIREQTVRIRELKFEKETVHLAAWNLMNKRQEERAREEERILEEEKARENEPPRTPLQEHLRRRQRILSHFRTHLMDIDYQEKQGKLKLDRGRIRQSLNEEVIRELEHGILETCRKVGKTGPQEIYDELLDGKSEYRCRDPRDEDYSYFQHEFYDSVSDDTDEPGMPSPSEIRKIQEQLAAQEQALKDLNIQPVALQEQLAAQEQALKDLNIQTAALQGQVPGPPELVQYPPFFHPQYGYFDPYAMYGGNFANPGIGELTTGFTASEAPEAIADDAVSLQSEPVDVYDAQGFPISSPLDQAANQLPGRVPGNYDSSSRISGVPMMNFPWMIPPQMQGHDGGLDGNFDFGENMIPAYNESAHGTAIRDQPTNISEQQ